MNEVKRYPVVPGFAPATLKLIEVLQAGAAGDELTDGKLAEVAGESVQVGTKGYAHLQSAIRYCIRHHNVYWMRVRTAGLLRCANASETIHAAEGDARRAGRVAKRGIGKLKTVDVGKLANGERTAYLTNYAQLGALATLGSKAAVERIATTKIDTVQQAMDVQKRLLAHVSA